MALGMEDVKRLRGDDFLGTDGHGFYKKNTDDTEVRRRTVEWNANYRELIVN